MADGLIAAASRRNPVDYHSAWRTEIPLFDEHGNVESFEQTISADEWIRDLLRRDLTNERSTFTFADLTQAVAARLDTGATVETIERIARRIIGSPQVVEVYTDNQPQQWTSRELLNTEAQFITALTTPSAKPIEHDVITTCLADRTDLGADQRAAVETIAATTAAVSVLVGPAGTGKTHTINAIRAVHEAAGFAVIGAAPSARAALELEAATGMTTNTLHRVLADIERSPDRPTVGTLLVIDEAGMADIRTLTKAVTHHVNNGGRILLAGDHHQLPEIGAGGGFAYAAQHAATVAELTINRRQKNPWEQHALTHLREGDVTRAVHAYVDHDRLTIADTPTDLVNIAIRQWANARCEGLSPVLLAGTNELVDQLNQAAIEHLIKAGELADTGQHPYGTTPLRIGERIVIRRNSDQTHDIHGGTARVINGHTGTVTAINAHNVTVALDHGDTITLDDHYLRRGGHVTHAYALTTHRAQGGTWDLAIAVGADTLHREAAYVQLSRGVKANHIILTNPEATALLNAAARDTARHDHGITHPDDEPDPAEVHLTARISRSAAKHLAHTLDANIARIDQLVATLPYPELAGRARHATYAEHLTTTTHGHTRQHLTDTINRLIHVATHIATGQHASPTDRHNIGTITHINDTDGTASIHFTSQNGHDAERTFAWDQLRLINPSQPGTRTLTDEATTTLHHLTTQLSSDIAAWDQSLKNHHAEPGDAHLYTSAARRSLELAASRLAAEQPDWLDNYLGQRPTDVAGSRSWDNAVTAIARWELTHPNGQADDPTGAHQLRTWLAQTRTWLDTTDRNTPSVPVVRTGIDIDTRRAQLEQIFDTAPADCRHIIDQLHQGQLTLHDTEQLLSDALDQQGARRQWILEHWPHIVEHHELEQLVSSSQPAFSISIA